MPAPKDNQFWKLRKKHGKDHIFKTPASLWKASCEYFDWCDKNPLKEEKVFHHQGRIASTEVNKLRAYTLKGLFIYLNCNDAYFRQFDTKEHPEFEDTIQRIKDVIFTQKFEGAAADLLNSNIIARELGLADKSEHTGEGGGPLIVEINRFANPDSE